jgi:hydrogenase-4 component F
VQRQPGTALAFVGGFAVISGFPPFGLILSEVLIIFGAFRQGQILSVSVLILCLILIFAGASRSIIQMACGDWEGEIATAERRWRLIPQFILLAASVTLTVWMPESMEQTIQSAIAALGGVIHG